MGPQEIAMVVGGVILLVVVIWVANKISNRFGSSSKQQ